MLLPFAGENIQKKTICNLVLICIKTKKIMMCIKIIKIMMIMAMIVGGIVWVLATLSENCHLSVKIHTNAISTQQIEQIENHNTKYSYDILTYFFSFDLVIITPDKKVKRRLKMFFSVLVLWKFNPDLIPQEKISLSITIFFNF